MLNENLKKVEALRSSGTFNARSKGVTDGLFAKGTFFDPQDLLQVKYEMLRRVREDGVSVAQASAEFGFSRMAYYEIFHAWEAEGVSGLFPRPRGPKHAHKLRAEVMDFIHGLQEKDSALHAHDLVEEIHKRFGLKVHPRSVERALARELKKGL